MTQSDKNKIAKALRSAYAYIEFNEQHEGKQDWFNQKSNLGKELQEALDLVEPIKQDHAE